MAPKASNCSYNTIIKKMPYSLRKAPRENKYWVITKGSGRKHSKKPLPKSRAQAQMRALYAAENGYILRRSSSRKKSNRKRSFKRRL